MTTHSSLLYELPGHTVRRTVVSTMSNNVYLITAKASGAQILIDAADDLPAIQALLDDAADDAAVPARLCAIATTHSHWDHVRALAALVDQTKVTTAAGAEDAAGIAQQCAVATDRPLHHGEKLVVPGLEVTAVHLRGHTPGSMAYVLESEDAAGARAGETFIFSGDSLFPGGVGNTGDDPQRFTSLLQDVQARLFDVYEDSAHVLPGHGDPTTLGTERPALPAWRERGW
ncbi:MBL fold metallo-hydrolase [Specibacter sp. NPDC057265]|uniref:MBL fold metallo-hydrolase n=1 Tax=Specibacter sp. NPDC057265 TaxID=3346075 RepID=UPI00364279C0